MVVVALHAITSYVFIAWQAHDVMVDAFSPHALIHYVVGFMAFVDVQLVLVVNELVVFVLVVCVQLYLLLLVKLFPYIFVPSLVTTSF